MINSLNNQLTCLIENQKWEDALNFIAKTKIKFNNGFNAHIFELIQKSKIIVFGQGEYFNEKNNSLSYYDIKLDIAYYLDNNPSLVSIKNNTYSPEVSNVTQYPILIASSYKKEISSQLLVLGAKEVYFLGDLFNEPLNHNITHILLEYIVKNGMPEKFTKLIIYSFNSYYFLSKLDLYKHTHFYKDKPLLDNISISFQNKKKRKYILPLLIYFKHATYAECINFLNKKNLFKYLDYHFYALLHNGLVHSISATELCSLIYKKIPLYSSLEIRLNMYLFISLTSKVHNLDTTQFFSLKELIFLKINSKRLQGIYSSILLNLIAQYETKKKLHTYLINKLFKCHKKQTFNNLIPKIALCISGQLRNYIYAFESMKKHFISNPNIEIDIYVHTWSNIGGRKLSAINIERQSSAKNFNTALKELTASFSDTKLQERYSSLNQHMLHNNTVTLEYLKKFYQTENIIIENDKDEAFNQLTNSEKMYYKIYAVNELVKESKKSYDLVIRIRPDEYIESFPSISWNKIVKECNQNNIIFGDTYNYTLDFSLFAMPEAFIIGSQRNMDIYSSTWKTLPYFKKNHLLGNRAQAHEAGAFRLWMANAKIQKLENFSFIVDNPNKLSAVDIYNILKDELEVSTSLFDKKLLKALYKDLKSG